ncbi:MAG: hypothetical protein ACREQ4_05100 [Candidatus Binataceae bacterium]
MRIPEANESSDTMSIAEFHDIGKIVNWFALGLQRRRADGGFEKEPHDFEKCIDPEWKVNFASPIWASIYRKDDVRELRLAHFPNSPDWFIVSLADGLAASMRRLPEKEVAGQSIYGRHCLWTGKTEPDLRLKQTEELKKLILHLNGNPAWETTDERYSRILHTRAECAVPGLNVATLHSHSVLTGKLFRVLRPAAWDAARRQRPWGAAFKAVEHERIVLLSLKVEFSQQPFRTRDLAIFSARRQAIAEAVSRFGDNVLIQYANNIVGFFLSDTAADDLVESFQKHGFTVSLVKAQQHTFGDLNSIGVDDALSKGRSSALYPALPDVIEPPLCENCQMAHGQHRWPADFLAGRADLSPNARTRISSMSWVAVRSHDFDEPDRTRLAEWLDEWAEERLCARCFDLRRVAPALSRLARWDTGKVAWARITIDLLELEEALRQLHIAYIKAQASRISDNLLSRKLSVRLPLLADFIADYERALGYWLRRLTDAFGQANVEEVDEGMVCVKLTEASGAIRLLEIHHDLLATHFPKLLELEVTPVRFALSISPAKHPFFANWRFLESSQTSVAVQLIGSGKAEIPINHLDALVRVIRQGGRHSFHRLRSIARTSKALAEIMLNDRRERDQTMEELRRILPLGMDFESLMTLANLAET